jgi:hypothetical protein
VNPTITRVEGGDMIPDEYMDVLYSALATLPALESLILSNTGRQARPEDESTIAHHESLTELLRVPSLRSVHACICMHAQFAHLSSYWYSLTISK